MNGMIVKTIEFLKSFTLKKRIVFIFAASTLIPLICTVLFSYHTMSSILTSKLNTSVRSNLKQVELSLENTINNLNHVSQQLAFPGSVGVKLDSYLRGVQPYERAKGYKDIKTELNVITSSNPSIGLRMYYFQESGTYIFNNAGLKDNFSLDHLPLLASGYKINNYGPHISMQRYNEQYVLSVLREVDLPNQDDVYLYIESAFNLTKEILQSDEIVKHSHHVILDSHGKIAYSELEQLFPVSSYFPSPKSGKKSGLINDYYWFKETTDQGWGIVSLIPKSQYNQEKDQWVIQMIYLTVLFVVLSLLIAWLLWMMVYKPLNQFHHEINLMTNSKFHTKAVHTRIPEFDQLLKRFQYMKQQISQLFKEVEQKEKRRADLEVEKLIHQINPHFLMNTLDSARWLAVMNGQTEIDRLISSLNKLLYYNLGKLGQLSSIREEIESMSQYLTLQQIRYDFDFDVNVHVADDVLHMPVPRFILQPLVENALYHGLNDDGHIAVIIKNTSQTVQISIHDNGAGIPEEKIYKLLNENQVQQRKDGMGIGMNYVKRMIERTYSGKAELEIKSTIGKGTSVFLTLPMMEASANDQGDGS